MSVKDSIFEALKAENLQLKSRVHSLEEMIIELDISRNKLDQYTRTNNIEIQGFQNNVILFVSENLSPFNQRFTWMYRELRRASKIYSAFSSKGIVKIRHTLNERPTSIEHDKDLTSLYPGFVFKEK